MRDVHKRYAELPLKRHQRMLHLLTQAEIERGKRLIKQQQSGRETIALASAAR